MDMDKLDRPRLATLLYNAMSYVFDHCEGYEEYVEALNTIGFNADEIEDELKNGCALPDMRIKDILRECDI